MSARRDFDFVAREQAAIPARSAEQCAKHRARAVEQLAAHRCATDLTDGFCSGPRDGRCEHPRLRHRAVDCMVQAEGLMQAIEGRGCAVVWIFDGAADDRP